MDKYLVERKWIIEAENSDDAIQRTKNWNHFEVHTKRLHIRRIEAD